MTGIQPALRTHAITRTATLAAALISALVVSGCSALTPPERPAWTGADNVNAAKPQQLVGSWRLTELNPLEGQPAQDMVYEYRADGTVFGTITPQGESAEALGGATFAAEGQWSLDGDTVRHTSMDIEMVGDEGGISSLMSRFMPRSASGVAGTANIHELSADRIVMVSEDGVAMQFDRQ